MKRFAGLSDWCLFQDSKSRYWLGLNEEGLGMYDPKTQQTYHWKSKGANAIEEDLDKKVVPVTLQNLNCPVIFKIRK